MVMTEPLRAPETAATPAPLRRERPREQRAADRGFWSGLIRVVLGGVAIAVLILAVAVVVAPRLMNAVPLTVLTSSMVPTYKPGDIVMSQHVNGADVHVGDVVTFQPESNDPALITHRVIAKSASATGVRLITQGDANPSPDDPILAEQVRGKIIYSVPLVGYATQLVPQVGRGPLITAAGVVFLVIAAVFIFRKPRATPTERTES